MRRTTTWRISRRSSSESEQAAASHKRPALGCALVAVALVAAPVAVLAPSTPAMAEAQTFYKIGYGDFGNTYLINPDGSNNERVANAVAADFDWTPDGRMFVWRANVSPGQLWIRNQDGAQFPVGTIGGRHPALSSDGTKIAYTRYDQTLDEDVVDVVDLSGNFIATLGPGRQPTWSPDGTKIAFAKRGGRTVGCGAPDTADPREIDFGSDGLAVAPATGGGSSWLIEPAKSQGGGAYWEVGSSPDWSPDGTEIVVHGTETEVYYDPGHGFFGGCATRGIGGNDSDIYKVSSSGGNPTNLTDGAAWIGGTFLNEPADLFPSFSPDGKQIAFASSRNTPRDGGIHSLWKMDAGGGNPTLVKVTDRVDATDWMTALPVGNVVRINGLEPCAYEEGPTPGVFTIERTGVTDGDVDVTIKVASSSTATSGDFEEIPTTVTIPDGTNLVNLVVFPIDDDVPEPEETIDVEIVSAEGGLLVGEPSKATMAIVDNDGGPPGPCSQVTPPPSKECQDATKRVTKLKAKLKTQQKGLRQAKKKAQTKKVKKLQKQIKTTKKKLKKAKKKAAAACD